MAGVQNQIGIGQGSPYLRRPYTPAAGGPVTGNVAGGMTGDPVSAFGRSSRPYGGATMPNTQHPLNPGETPNPFGSAGMGPVAPNPAAGGAPPPGIHPGMQHAPGEPQRYGFGGGSVPFRQAPQMPPPMGLQQLPPQVLAVLSSLGGGGLPPQAGMQSMNNGGYGIQPPMQSMNNGGYGMVQPGMQTLNNGGYGTAPQYEQLIQALMAMSNGGMR